MLCVRCGGTGKYFGLGMMPTNCELCGDLALYAPKPIAPTPAPASAPPQPIDKRSKAYKDAINSMMRDNPTLLRSDAAALFEKSFKGLSDA